MVWSNFQNFWLTALLLITPVLPLVYGEYATCPTTEGLNIKGQIDNASHYVEKECTGGDKCCARKEIDGTVIIKIGCAASCKSNEVDCSDPANRCRNAAEVVEYYKSSAFINCPYSDHTGWKETFPTSLPYVLEGLCPATDKCSVVRMKQDGRTRSYYYAKFWCMSYCKKQRVKYVRGSSYFEADCKECSGFEDCKQKLARVVSYWYCPTTKGKRVYTLNELEYVYEYNREDYIDVKYIDQTACTDSEKCCVEKSTGPGRLSIKVECSASCDSPKIRTFEENCVHESRKGCFDQWRLYKLHKNPDTVSCMSLTETRAVFKHEGIPEFKNVDTVYCLKSEGCSVGRFDVVRIQEVSVYQAFAGCMTDCEHFYQINGNPNVCKSCSTTEDCRKILLALNDTKLATP